MNCRRKYGVFMLVVFLVVSVIPAFAFVEKKTADEGLYKEDVVDAFNVTLASTPALIDGNKTTSTGINIGGGVANDNQNIGLHLTFSTEIDKIYLYTTTLDNNFNKNNFVWAVYSSSDNVTWTVITGAAGFDYNTIPIQQRFEISFAKTTARYFKVVNTANDAYDLYVTEIEAYGTSLKEGDINADGDVNLTDAVLALQVMAGIEPSAPVYKEADVNGDDRIGLVEAIYVLQEVAGLRNHPPELNPIGNKTIDEDSELSFSISASDPDNDPLTYSASGLPDGATFDPGSKTFSWTPTYFQSGIYNVTFTVTDSSGDSDSETIMITVNDKTPIFTASEYFPLTVGNWWDYKDDVTGEVNRTTVSGTKSIGGTVTKIFEYASGYKQYFTSDSNGIKLYGEYVMSDYYTGDVYFDTPLLYIPNNSQIGTTQVSTTTYSFTIYIPDHGNVLVNVDLTSTTTVIGLEDVTTEHTTLRDCIKVSNQITQYVNVAGETATVTGDTVYYWFYKGVGVIKDSSSEHTATITASHVNGENRTY